MHTCMRRNIYSYTYVRTINVMLNIHGMLKFAIGDLRTIHADIQNAIANSCVLRSVEAIR